MKNKFFKKIQNFEINSQNDKSGPKNRQSGKTANFDVGEKMDAVFEISNQKLIKFD